MGASGRVSVHDVASSPSVFIFKAVRTRAKSVALNMTVPSLFNGMFIATSLYGGEGGG